MRTILALSLSLALATPAAALNWIPLMKNSPAERFDEDDLHMFLDSGRKALNEMPDKQTVGWENPDTKHRGDFTILKTFQKDGRSCKQVRVRTEADGRKANTVINTCRVDGKWRLISPPQRN